MCGTNKNPIYGHLVALLCLTAAVAPPIKIMAVNCVENCLVSMLRYKTQICWKKSEKVSDFQK